MSSSSSSSSLLRSLSYVELIYVLLTFNDVVPHECDVVIPVRARLFVEKSQSVTCKTGKKVES